MRYELTILKSVSAGENLDRLHTTVLHSSVVYIMNSLHIQLFGFLIMICHMNSYCPVPADVCLISRCQQPTCGAGLAGRHCQLKWTPGSLTFSANEYPNKQTKMKNIVPAFSSDNKASFEVLLQPLFRVK